MSDLTGYGADSLDTGIRSRFISGVNGLTMHVLEAGWEGEERPRLLMLHGFPEIAYSWRKVMPILAAAGFHVVAPDQRGYGRTTGWTADYDDSLIPYGMLNLTRDVVGLVSALGWDSVDGVIGHDFGSPVAAYCALIRPDIFPIGRDDERAPSPGRLACRRVSIEVRARRVRRVSPMTWLPWIVRASTTSSTTARGRPTRT